jgi:protein-disulfide isomerase
MLNLKPLLPAIAISVVLSQVATFGGLAAFNAWQGGRYLDDEVAAAVDDLIFQRELKEIEAYASAQYARYPKAVDTVPNDARVYGDLKARFTLAEFSDMECPFCKKLHPTMKEIVERSNGAVNWQWRHLPLSFHNPAANDEAKASECFAEQKGNKGFWVFLDQVFDLSAGNGGGVKDLPALAKRLGGDKEKFKECMASERHKDRINEHVLMGQKIGATGTPATMVIDNLTGEKEFVSGAQPASAFITVMKKMMVSERADAQADEQKRRGEPVDGGAVVSEQILGYGGRAVAAPEAEKMAPVATAGEEQDAATDEQ